MKTIVVKNQMCFTMKALLTGILLVCAFSLIRSEPLEHDGPLHWSPPFNPKGGNPHSAGEASARFFDIAVYLPPKPPQVWPSPHVPVGSPYWHNSPSFNPLEQNPFIIPPNLNELDDIPTPRRRRGRGRGRGRPGRGRGRHPRPPPAPEPAPEPAPAPAPDPAAAAAPDPAAPAPASDEVSPRFFDLALYLPPKAPLW